MLRSIPGALIEYNKSQPQANIKVQWQGCPPHLGTMRETSFLFFVFCSALNILQFLSLNTTDKNS